VETRAVYIIQGILVQGSTKRCQTKLATSHSNGVGWLFVWVLCTGIPFLQVVGSMCPAQPLKPIYAPFKGASQWRQGDQFKATGGVHLANGGWSWASHLRHIVWAGESTEAIDTADSSCRRDAAL